MKNNKLCLGVLTGMLAAVALCYGLTEDTTTQLQPEDKPCVKTDWQMPVESPRLLEAMAVQLERGLYREEVPLTRDQQAALRAACWENGVPIPLALGLIEVESQFDPEADNGLCYGYCQLNRRYYPSKLTPEENIHAGVIHLRGLLDRYGDTAAALAAYNAGRDTGSRTYASAVMAAAEGWEERLCTRGKCLRSTGCGAS